MDNSTQLPVHDEGKFTTGSIAGRSVLVTEAGALGPRWFGRDRAGGSAFAVECPLTSAKTTYHFRRESTTELGKRYEYRGSDGSTAYVYES